MRISAILATLALAACASQASRPVVGTAAPTMGGAESRELLPDQQIQHVLNRLAFGPRPGDAAKVRAMGVDKWIDMQLHPERIDDASANQLMAAYPVLGTHTDEIVRGFTELQRAQRERQKDAAAVGDTANKRDTRRELLMQDPTLAEAARKTQRLVPDVQSVKLARALTSERQLDEVMVDFWENHFSVFAAKGQTRLFLADYDQNVIRPRVLGKFRDLLGAVAHSPAMLFYLDNWQSAADSLHPTLTAMRNPRMAARRQQTIANLPPKQQQVARRGLNENYARELMELHTLGVDGGYTQKDVQEVARALTGWSFNRQSGEFVFNPAVHDAGEKIVLGHKLAAGRGIEDGEDVLDIVAKSPATARFITTKLARHFVSDEPPPSLVQRCSQVFSRTSGDIRETLGCVVTSPEFFSRSAYRAKVKTPFEVVASGLRALGAQPDTTPRASQLVARLGQPIFGRQTPDGWPDRGEAWMNTGAILNRINFGLALAGGQVPGARLQQWPDFASLRSVSRTQQVDGVIKSILGGEVSAETREVLVSGENPMVAKAATVEPIMADSTQMMNGRGRQGGPLGGGGRGRGGAGPMTPVNLQGLAQVVGLALGAPEFQRR